MDDQDTAKVGEDKLNANCDYCVSSKWVVVKSKKVERREKNKEQKKAEQRDTKIEKQVDGVEKQMTKDQMNDKVKIVGMNSQKMQLEVESAEKFIGNV